MRWDQVANGAAYDQKDPLAFPSGGGYKWANPPLHFDDALHGLQLLLSAASAGVMPSQNIAFDVSEYAHRKM